MKQSSSRSRRSFAIVALPFLLLLCLSPSPSDARASWTGYAASITPEALVPFDTATGKTGKPIDFFNSPRGLTFSPDGKTAYVLAYNPYRVIPLDVETGFERPPIPIPNPVGRIAIIPDGSALYITSTNAGLVYRVDLATGTVEEPIEIGAQAWGLAIAPDGGTAYVTTGSYPTFPASYAGVAAVDLATRTVTQVGVTDSAMDGVGILPDGGSAYAIGSGLNRAFRVDTASDTIAGDLAAGLQAGKIAITPDGTTALVTNFSSDQVTSLDLTTNTTGPAIPVGDNPADIAITPDSKTAFVSNRNSEDITPIDLETLTAGAPIHVGGQLSSIMIRPNQPPVSRFTTGIAEPGKPVELDATASTDNDGEIARYAWDFGDGNSTVTTGAKVDHTYATAGSYTVRLTLTDETGCSTETVFTGQVASCNGQGGAVSEQAVQVKARSFCETHPADPACRGATVKLGPLKVTPRNKAVKRGRKVTLKAAIRNLGDSAATNVKVCAKAPRRQVTVKPCRTRKLLPARATAKFNFAVKVKPKAKRGRKVKVKFTASAAGRKLRNATVTLRPR